MSWLASNLPLLIGACSALGALLSSFKWAPNFWRGVIRASIGLWNSEREREKRVQLEEDMLDARTEAQALTKELREVRAEMRELREENRTLYDRIAELEQRERELNADLAITRTLIAELTTELASLRDSMTGSSGGAGTDATPSTTSSPLPARRKPSSDPPVTPE